MFPQGVQPASVTIHDGIAIALTALAASWKRWLPLVVVVTAAQMIMAAIAIAALTQGEYYATHSGDIVWIASQDRVPWTIAFGVGIAISGLVGWWYFVGLAICRLRGRPVEARWVAQRGLVTLGAQLLIGCWAVVVAVAAFVLARALGGLAFVLLPVAVCCGVYVSLRLAFVGLAIFDGRGPVDGIVSAWDLSHGCVVRIFGWSLAAGLIFGAMTLLSFQTAPLFGCAIDLALGVQMFVRLMGMLFVTFLLAVLYESETARHAARTSETEPQPEAPAIGSAVPSAD